MKILENPKFEALNAALCRTQDGFVVDGRLESYSCKMIGSDKKLFKYVIQHNRGAPGVTEGATGAPPRHAAPAELHALSPPQGSLLSVSPVSRSYSRSWSDVPPEDDTPRLCDTISTRTLFYLISTLNASFNPDYDFSTAKSDEFSRLRRLRDVMSEIDGRLMTKVTDYGSLKSNFWAAINEEIHLSDCEIYSYNADQQGSGDPFGEEGFMLGLCYFFYNKKLKRLVFFSCRYSTLDAAEESGDQGYASSLIFDGSDFDDDRQDE